MKARSSSFILHPSSFEKGFTLLEIMIALAIIGGLLVTLIYTLNYHLGIAERHESLTIATILARDKMSEIEKNPAETEGDFPEPYNAYHYATTISASSFPELSELSVVVSNGKEEVKLTEIMKMNPVEGGK
ncbi:MAG: type II secretion system protein [Thermodesulfovibrionales bacterium]